MKMYRFATSWLALTCLGILAPIGRAQSTVDWHALISTVTALRGEDGHRRLSFPALIAPYAGTMMAVYAWYPERYGPKDALRMGNYNLLAFAGENVALEFIYGEPHTLFSHLHRPDFSGTDAGSSSSH